MNSFAQDGTAIVLPSLPTLDSSSCTSPAITNSSERFVRLIGLRSRTAAAHPQTQPEQSPVVLPTLPSLSAVDSNVRRCAAETDVPARATVEWQSGNTTSVIPAAASGAVTNRLTDSGSPEITLTISSEEANSSFDDIDIPLMLPPRAVAPQRAQARIEVSQPTAPSPRNTEVQDVQRRQPIPMESSRAPQVVSGGGVMRLTSQSSQPETVPPQSPTTLRMAPTSSAPPTTEKRIPAPKNITSTDSEDSAGGTSFSLSDSSMLAAPKLEVPQPNAPPTQSVARKLPKLETPVAHSTLNPITDAALPSTSSSRNAPVTASAPMQVRVEGVETPTGNALANNSSRLPRPMFEAPAEEPEAPQHFQLRSEDSAPPTTNSGTRVPARLASQQTRPQLDDDTTSSRRAPQVDYSGADVVQSSGSISVATEEAQPIAVTSLILQLSVEDQTVCRVIQNGDNGLSVVGLKPGSTRIAIVREGADDKPVVEVHQVVVGNGSQTTAGLKHLADGISETISKLYPSSRINVSGNEDRLVVSGYASSEAEAKRVLSLVRRTSLLPVVDQLKVR